MTMTRYIVGHGGERLDVIARAIYGTEKDGTVEALLAANPGLATLHAGGRLPEGATIEAPAGVASAPRPGFTLAWE